VTWGTAASRREHSRATPALGQRADEDGASVREDCLQVVALEARQFTVGEFELRLVLVGYGLGQMAAELRRERGWKPEDADAFAELVSRLRVEEGLLK
jgi:hypothetical protein